MAGKFQARSRLAAVRQYFLGRKPALGARNETVSTPGGAEGGGRRASPREGPPGREPPQGPQAPGSQSLQTRFKFRPSILVLAAGLTRSPTAGQSPQARLLGPGMECVVSSLPEANYVLMTVSWSRGTVMKRRMEERSEPETSATPTHISKPGTPVYTP